MKGTVAPPSSNVTVASTCSARTPSSCAIFWLIFATREPLYPSTQREPKSGSRDAAYGPTEVDSSRCGAQPSTEDFFVMAMRSRHNRAGGRMVHILHSLNTLTAAP